jgi:hypothetical protein
MENPVQPGSVNKLSSSKLFKFARIQIELRNDGPIAKQQLGGLRDSGRDSITIAA